MKIPSAVSIVQMRGGAFLERADYEMAKIMNNIIDPNTKATAKAMYWNRNKMERHALRYAKGYAAKKGYTFWEKDFDGMAYKTMLRQLISKWGIMTVDLQTAFEQDVVAEQDEQGNTTITRPDKTPTEDPAFPDAQDMEPTPPAEDEPPLPEEPPASREVSLDDL